MIWMFKLIYNVRSYLQSLLTNFGGLKIIFVLLLSAFRVGTVYENLKHCIQIHYHFM